MAGCGHLWLGKLRKLALSQDSRCVTAEVSAPYAVFCHCFTPMYQHIAFCREDNVDLPITDVFIRLSLAHICVHKLSLLVCVYICLVVNILNTASGVV